MRHVALSSLFLISFALLYKGNADACPHTELGFGVSIPQDIKICESYIRGFDEALQNDTRWRGSQGWLGNPKNRVSLADKYTYFRRYEQVLFRTRSHCSYDTHALIGVIDDNDNRTCHIAFEENSPLSLLDPNGRNNIILKTLNKNYKLVSGEKETIESDFVNTSITVSEYCGVDDLKFKLTTISVDEPSKPYTEGDDFRTYQAKKKRPLQHLRLTNEPCDIPTE